MDGNLEAFNSLVDCYQSAVYSLSYRLLGNREAAEDAAQETFLSAFRALGRFAGGNFRSWLLRIAANECKDELRRRKRKDALSLDEIFGRTESPIEIHHPSERAEIRVEEHEMSAGIERILLNLPFEQRQAILLVDIYDFHYEEVATMTLSSIGTIKSRIHRGRQRLRELFESHPELFEGADRREDQR